MERLPLLGSEEHKQWCIEGDKELNSRDYSTPKVKGSKPFRKPLPLQVTAHPIEVRKRGVEIYMASRGKLSYWQAARRLYAETKVDITDALLKQWVLKHRKNLKAAKEKSK